MSLQSIFDDAIANIRSKIDPKSIKKEAVADGIQNLVLAIEELPGSGIRIQNDKLILGLDLDNLPSGQLTNPTMLLLGDVTTGVYNVIQILNESCGIHSKSGTEISNPNGVSTDVISSIENGFSIDVRKNNNDDYSQFIVGAGSISINLVKDASLVGSLQMDTGGFIFANSESKPAKYNTIPNITNDEDIPYKKYVDDMTSTTVNIVTQSLSLALQVSVCYTYDGTGDAVFTLPAIIGTEGKRIAIICDSASTVTVNSNAGSNDIFDSGVKTNTSTINAGTARVLLNNTKNWVYLT